MTLSLLILIAPPALEETLTDWLLAQPAVSGFNSHMGYGHGSREADMTLAAQVAGREKRIQFSLHAETAVVLALVAEARVHFAGAGMHYMVLPLSEGESL